MFWRYNKQATLSALGATAFMIVADWETEEDNPVEQKYRKMAHDVIRGLVRSTFRSYAYPYIHSSVHILHPLIVTASPLQQLSMYLKLCL
jgi:hypothetical protein